MVFQCMKYVSEMLGRLGNAKEVASNSKLLVLFNFNSKKIILLLYVKKVKLAEWLENNLK